LGGNCLGYQIEFVSESSTTWYKNPYK
jgi:hypothetical protein